MRKRSETVRRLAAGLGAAVLVIVGASGCSEEDAVPDGAVSEPAPSQPVGPPYSGADLWLSFDEKDVAFDGSPEFVDALDGPYAGRVVTASGGTVESVRGAPGRGRAVQFPQRCSAGTGCPRAMVEVAADRSLDPADRPFSFGASVWLPADQTAIGSNIVQQGRFGSSGGQWKLQVDGEDGRPSCVLRAGDDVWRVRSDVPIADSTWHEVVCRRDADGISITVDGAVDRTAGGQGSVSNELPIRIGSPGVADDDDQFHGRIDDVFVRIDSSR